MSKYSLSRRINKWLGRHKPALKTGVRKDVVEIAVADQVQLTVYWKVLPHGRGPAMILDTPWVELAKFDCFGPGLGHFHYQPDYERQYAFSSRSSKEQIEEAGQLLLKRFEEFLAANRFAVRQDVRQLKEKLPGAIEEAQLVMSHYLDSIPDLRNI